MKALETKVDDLRNELRSTVERLEGKQRLVDPPPPQDVAAGFRDSTRHHEAAQEGLSEALKELAEERSHVADMLEAVRQEKLEVIRAMHTFVVRKDEAVQELEAAHGKACEELRLEVNNAMASASLRLAANRNVNLVQSTSPMPHLPPSPSPRQRGPLAVGDETTLPDAVRRQMSQSVSAYALPSQPVLAVAPSQVEIIQQQQQTGAAPQPQQQQQAAAMPVLASPMPFQARSSLGGGASDVRLIAALQSSIVEPQRRSLRRMISSGGLATAVAAPLPLSSPRTIVGGHPSGVVQASPRGSIYSQGYPSATSTSMHPIYMKHR
jgi:hypothetical protein